MRRTNACSQARQSRATDRGLDDMKKHRPTIPLFEWKLAIDLESTREIQNQKGKLPDACDCEWCHKWKHCFVDILPEGLQEQLARIGVVLDKPTDLYKFKDNESGVSIRVVYHAVGNVLSGPNQWESTDIGEMLMYRIIRDEPYLSLVVLPQNQALGKAPTLRDSSAGKLICIDFRFEIPNQAVGTDVPKRA